MQLHTATLYFRLKQNIYFEIADVDVDVGVDVDVDADAVEC